jgi:hypothetical protein
MTKHTPGPWKCSEWTRNWTVYSDNTGDEIVEVQAVDDADENTKACADAHLIAAAPDLLAVLEELLPDLQCRCDVAFTSRGKHQPNTLCRHKDGVKAAIAKARGQG